MAHDLKRSDLWGTQPVSTVIVSIREITACNLCTVIYACDVFLRPNLNLFFFFQKGSHCRFSSCTWLPSKIQRKSLKCCLMLIHIVQVPALTIIYIRAKPSLQSWKVLKLSSLSGKVQGW